MKTYVIGIDLGGTNLKAAAVGDDGMLQARRTVPVGSDKSAAAIASRIAAEVRAIVQEVGYPPAAVGCGVPGIVDVEHGIVFASPNFPPWHDEPVREMLEERVSLPIVIDNDANLHALAEARCGAGRGARNAVVLTLGTGIGGGLIFDGEIFHGDAGFAGEVGHIVVEPEGIPCGCGGRGCLELYAASRAFAVHTSRLPDAEREAFLKAAGVDIWNLSPAIASELADAGNATAIRLWGHFGTYLGVGIATLVNILGVMTFVLGGGIARSFDRFIDACRSSALRHTYRQHAEVLRIKRAELGDDAGPLGAALLARSAVVGR